MKDSFESKRFIFTGPSPGPVFDLGTKSRGIKLPRDFNGTFCTGSGNHGTDFFFLVRDAATAVFPGTGCSHDGIQRDFLYGIRPTAGLPGRDAATTGRNGIVCAGSGHRGTLRAGCSHGGTQRDFFGAARIVCSII